jgi:hypothetical protein
MSVEYVKKDVKTLSTSIEFAVAVLEKDTQQKIEDGTEDK